MSDKGKTRIATELAQDFNMSQMSAFGTSDTKFFYDLTPDRILDAVENLGLVPTGRCLQLNSMENRVYEIEIDVEDVALAPNARERFRIVKFYRPGRWSKIQIEEEHRFLLDLAEHEIPVIAPIRNESGDTVFPSAGGEIFFSLFPKGGGRSPDELDDAQALQVGRLLARMHNIGAMQVAPNRLQMTPEEFSDPSLDFLLDGDCIPDFLYSQFDEILEEILSRVIPLFNGVQLQRIHGDAHLGNLLWGPAGAFWVDFDDMVTGPCVQDLWLLLPGRDEFAQAKLKVILEGYEQFRPFDRAELKLIEPLRTMRIIHFMAWIAKRWDDPAFQRTFVNFGTEKYWIEQLATMREQLEYL